MALRYTPGGESFVTLRLEDYAALQKENERLADESAELQAENEQLKGQKKAAQDECDRLVRIVALLDKDAESNYHKSLVAAHNREIAARAVEAYGEHRNKCRRSHTYVAKSGVGSDPWKYADKIRNGEVEL